VPQNDEKSTNQKVKMIFGMYVLRWQASI